MAAFATAADMIARYDSRTLGDLVSDTGAAVAEGGLAADTKMIAALASATGELKAALQRGKRYTTAQLTALTGESQAYLVTLTCAIAFWYLWRRKPPYSEADAQFRQNARAEFEEAIEKLVSGENIFDIDELVDASIPKVDTVSRIEATGWNLLADACRGRFFPRRRSYRNR